MDKLIKHLPRAQVFAMADEVQYLPGQIVSKTLSQNKSHSLTLFAFDKGEEISAHKSKGDAMVYALDGVGRITIDDEDFIIKAGEAIIMPAGIPHAVYGEERFKMLLIVVFPLQESKDTREIKVKVKEK